jgi:surface antigen
MISDYNYQKGSLLFGYLDGKGGDYDGDGNIIVKANPAPTANSQVAATDTDNLIKVASADNSYWGSSNASDPQAQNDDENAIQTISSNNQTPQVDFSPMLVQGDFFVASSAYDDESSDDQRYGIEKYTVEDGDTPSSIATSYGISTYTVLWANNLKVGDFIKPGQVLDILPITGVRHVVGEKDTIEAIAKKYNADVEEIILYNELPANGKLTPGRTLIIPNGEEEEPVQAPKPQPATTQGKIVSTTKYTYTANTGNGHRFPYGQCTWYVASRVYVPWGGNAKAWLSNAASYGYKTGRTPVPGAIVVTSESRLYGHVAYVESVGPDSVTISEMNYVGWARKSVRVLDRTSAVIMGYVYPGK